MSWDLFVLRLPADFRTVNDLPDDFDPEVIGPRVDVIRAITEVAPFADFSDQSWGHIDTPDFSVWECEHLPGSCPVVHLADRG